MNTYKIEDVIAHREPMILITRLLRFDECSALAEVDITEKSPFYDVEQRGVASYVGIEYMAQTIAALAGAKAKDMGKEVDIGFLLGSRKYETFLPYFQLGKTYQVNVKELYKEDSGLNVFECEILLEEVTIAKAKVNAFQPENPEEFLKEQ